jgi:hypothetical protein
VHILTLLRPSTTRKRFDFSLALSLLAINVSKPWQIHACTPKAVVESSASLKMTDDVVTEGGKTRTP